jgi:hypothetical protein
MTIQVNTRLPAEEWEQIVEAMPGMSNAERMTQLVHQQLDLLKARKDLSAALRLTEELLAPVLQGLREQGLHGKGSDFAETLSRTVAEMAAVLLSHSDGLRQAPEATVARLDALLVQRWTRATLHLLRNATLEPTSVRNPAAVEPEIRRIFDHVALLQRARTAATAPHPEPSSDASSIPNPQLS